MLGLMITIGRAKPGGLYLSNRSTKGTTKKGQALVGSRTRIDLDSNLRAGGRNGIA